MPTKAFDINHWIQGIIGALLIASIFGLLKMYGDVETMKIEKRQYEQVILKLDAQSTIVAGKINELSQEIALLKQTIKIIARTKGMDSMIKFDDPKFIDPSHEAKNTMYQSRVASDCEGKECYPPVPPPPPDLS